MDATSFTNYNARSIAYLTTLDRDLIFKSLETRFWRKRWTGVRSPIISLLLS